MKVIIIAVLTAAVYFVTVIYLMNYRLVGNTILGDYGLNYKTSLLFSLLGGMWTAMTPSGLIVLILTSALTGINISLIIQRLKFMTGLGGFHLVAGGSSVFSLVSSGCASCGLPVLSLLGLSGSLVYLPFRGLELSFFSVILLTISFVILIRGNRMDRACTITKK